MSEKFWKVFLGCGIACALILTVSALKMGAFKAVDAEGTLAVVLDPALFGLYLAESLAVLGIKPCAKFLAKLSCSTPAKKGQVVPFKQPRQGGVKRRIS